jgi:hypothetical protein
MIVGLCTEGSEWAEMDDPVVLDAIMVRNVTARGAISRATINHLKAALYRSTRKKRSLRLKRVAAITPLAHS